MFTSLVFTDVRCPDEYQHAEKKIQVFPADIPANMPVVFIYNQ